MYKSLPFFIDNNLPSMYESFEFIEKNIVKEDLSRINNVDLKKFHEEHKFIYNELLEGLPEDKKIIELKKYYLADLFSNIISKKRIDTLLNTDKPYDSEDLKGLNINSDGLVDFNDYLNFHSKNRYMLCLPINAENSNYWIGLELDSLKNNKDISLKIRLDPLVKNPIPIIYKMTVFGEQLNWKKLSKIKERNVVSFMDEKDWRKTDLYWEKNNNELHFKCEELPLHEELRKRGSRYFHAIYDINNEYITHCDGSIKIYNEKDFLKRNNISLWDKNSKNYGKYVKIFQADGQINTDNFTKIISSYYVWNHDITNYFEKMKL